MKVERATRPNWPTFKSYIAFTELVTMSEAVAWRKRTKVKCLIKSGRIYFVTEKDAMAFWLRWA